MYFFVSLFKFFNFHACDLCAANDPFPLHKASREGAAEILHRLLESGQGEINSGGYDLIRPLHEACLHGHIRCVELLLQYGAQVVHEYQSIDHLQDKVLQTCVSECI